MILLFLITGSYPKLIRKLLRMVKQKFRGMVKFILAQCSISILSENTRKPTGGVRIFQNWWKWGGGGVWKFLLEKGGGGLSRNGGLPYWDFSGDSSWCSIEKKYWCVYLSFVNKNMLQNNCISKIGDDWDCNSFNIVDSYNSCINYSCK